VRRLGDEAAVAVVGGKAYNLGVLLRAGLPVPPGWVIDVDTPVDAALLRALADLPDGSYAVRSSGVQEDLAGASFAGQYVTALRVPRDGLAEAVARCQESVHSAAATAYRERSGLAAAGMAVIVQAMVEAEYAGVAFTVDPVSGADTHLVVEYAPGLGNSLVNGEIVPRTARYDWDREEWLDDPAPPQPWLAELARLAVAAQQLYGYPLDLEFAYAAGTVWLLQARPVTRIGQAGLTDLWTTADFRDGGVSAEVCKPYMWSLYAYVWDSAFRDFLVRSRLIAPAQLGELGKMAYGRGYWNLGVGKTVMARVPGYREREFDAEFGIPPAYEGDGHVTRFTPRTLAHLVPVALVQSRLLARREAEAPHLAARLRATATRRLAALPGLSGDGILTGFLELTRDDYLDSESTYFWQIFLNTIHQSLYRDAVRDVVDDTGYLELLSGLEDVSHLRAVADLWRIGRTMGPAGAGAGDAVEPLPGVSTPQPDGLLAQPPGGWSAKIAGVSSAEPALAEHLARFGYHSDKELDVSYPNYWEQPEVVAAQLAELSRLTPEHDPAATTAAQAAVFLARMARLRADLPARAYAKLERKTLRVRRLLWWREEFRDLSTRMYDVIRRYTIALAGVLCADGALDDPDDIWYIPVTTLWAYIQAAPAVAPDLRAVAARGRRYYQAYRNFRGDDELIPAGYGRGTGGGARQAGVSPGRSADPGVLHGIGCSPGRVTATARVVDGLAGIGRLQPGDILVTRYTDTGWTAKFTLLAGVVTEYGGMLCHSAIVSREYGIPCVVAVPGVLSRVRDGEPLTVDGSTGEVTLP